MKKEQGFTLLEVIVVITILGLVVSTLTDLFSTGVGFWQRSSNQTELQYNLRFALRDMVADIRMAREILAIDSGYIKFLDAAGNEITYELDEDPLLEQEPYTLTGMILYRQEGSAPRQPVAGFITSFTIAWEPQGADPEAIRFIDITLKGEPPTGNELIMSSGVEIKWKSIH
jgi:prepilin-type N-terminal cleavage/methylation domain-containing protein